MRVNKFSSKFFIFFIFLMLLLTSFSVFVSAAEVTIEDFETYASGSITGTNGLNTWERESGDDFEVYDTGINQVLLLASAGGAFTGHIPVGDPNADIGWMNLTAAYTGLDLDFYSRKQTHGGTSDFSTTIYFYNASGGEVLKILIQTLYTSDEIEVYYYDYLDENTNTIITGLEDLTWYRLSLFQDGSHPNEYTYNIYNESDGLLASVSGYNRISGADIPSNKTELNFEDIKITAASGAYGGVLYLDNVKANTDTSAYDAFTSLGADSRCANPISGYNQMMYPKPDVDGCSFDMGCLLLSPPWLWGRCVDCPYSNFPCEYAEWQSNNYRSETITNVLLPIGLEQIIHVSNNPSHYILSIGNNYIGGADEIISYGNGFAVVWENTNISIINERPLFSFRCLDHSIGFAENWHWYGIGIFYGGNGATRSHNSYAQSVNSILDGYIPGNMNIAVCWSYNNSEFATPDQPPECNPNVIDIFDDKFGNATTGGDTHKGYIEFAVWDQECDYRVGDSPSIVYNLSGFIGDDTTKRCLYRIWQIGNGTDNLLVFNDYIDISDDWRRGYRDLTDRFAFSSSGSYYIMVYNTTDEGNTLSEFIDISLTISVCNIPGSGYIPGQTGPLPDPFDFSDIPVLFKVIISLFIIIILTISPYFFASMINKGRVQIQMPSLVYVAFFFIGVVASIMLGFLEIWVFFVILVGLILTIVVFWLQGKDISSGGE